jgi:hypothetical protein
LRFRLLAQAVARNNTERTPRAYRPGGRLGAAITAGSAFKPTAARGAADSVDNAITNGRSAKSNE